MDERAMEEGTRFGHVEKVCWKCWGCENGVMECYGREGTRWNGYGRVMGEGLGQGKRERYVGNVW